MHIMSPSFCVLLFRIYNAPYVCVSLYPCPLSLFLLYRLLIFLEIFISIWNVASGFKEFKRVDILWDSKCKPDGQLFLKITMAESCPPRKFWRTLQNACLPVMDIIDWERSRPDGVYDFYDVFGIISSYSYFLGVGGPPCNNFKYFTIRTYLVGHLLAFIMCWLQSLKSAVSDIGRNIHLEHLLLVSDSLSVTGEFHGLSAKGIKQQRAHMSISSPFTQACFSVSYFSSYSTHFCTGFAMYVSTSSFNNVPMESCRIQRNALLRQVSRD